MIRHVYRPKRKRGGKSVPARLYRGRFRLDGEEKVREIALQTTDKLVAEQRLRTIVREQQQEREGILPPKNLREGAFRPLRDHLADFLREREALGRGEKYVRQLNQQLAKLFGECRWTQFRDISPGSFQEWRILQKYSAKTLNEYLGSACAFLNWMEQTGKSSTNPLRTVCKVEVRGRATKERRSLSIVQLKRLVEASGERGAIYAVAAYTGLRRGELAKVEWRDLHLDRELPVIQVRAATTKNKKDATIPLHPSIVSRLKALRTEACEPGDRVFPRIPRVHILQTDLAKAGIVAKDEHGRSIDFHALRMTTATLLTVNGTPQREIMELMRHSDMRLTAKVYTDVGLLPLSETVLKLPGLDDPQIAPQNTVSNGPTVSRFVPFLKNGHSTQPPHGERLDPESPILSLAVRLVKMVRDAGFEPATLAVSGFLGALFFTVCESIWSSVTHAFYSPPQLPEFSFVGRFERLIE